MHKARRFISREKVFLVGFSLAFPRFPQILKKRLNNSLRWKLKKIYYVVFSSDVFFKEPDDWKKQYI